MTVHRDPPTVLLTGGSGVVGAALRERLSGHNVICLTHQQPLPDHPGEVVRGDLRAPRMGLRASEYTSLAGRVNVVIHAAAVTDFGRTDDSIESTNVNGVRNIVEFAATADAALYHVSTAYVAGDDDTAEPAHQRGGTAEPAAHQRGAMPYPVSKREGERIVRESGLRWTILRPSIVVGCSRTGATSRFQGIYQVARALLMGALPVVPLKDAGMIDFVPRDLVADVVVRLVDSGAGAGETLWLTAGERSLTVRETFGVAVDFGHRLGKSIPMPRFVTPDVYERLIAPVFLHALPARQRRFVEGVFDSFAPYVGSATTLASSVPELADRLALPELPDQRTILSRSLDYWWMAQQRTPAA